MHRSNHRPYHRTGVWLSCASAILWLFAISVPARAESVETAASTSAMNSPTTANDPMTVIKDGIGNAILVFQDHQMPLAKRRQTLRNLAEQYFDFPMMSQSVLGYHWRTLTPEQRAQFVPIFTGFIEDAYLSKLQDYTVRRVQEALQTARINYIKQNLDGSDYAQVFTTVSLHNEANPIEVNYYLCRMQGTWKVYDLSIESISVIANFRNQFERVINSAGYDALLADLRAKQQHLQQDLDNPEPSS